MEINGLPLPWSCPSPGILKPTPGNQGVFPLGVRFLCQPLEFRIDLPPCYSAALRGNLVGCTAEQH